MTFREKRDEQDRAEIRAALEASGWRLAPAAVALAIWPSDLRRRLERLGMAEEYATRNPGPGRPKKAGAAPT